ncbi:TetR/AcrR family transcriptional regulator [Stakelama tenebrarum]|uniref:TetR/AcrR family transcriptional regulator n=1 Tax=Stakelama tenebrarum TaxID=2711215 RepID=A0A6G6Y6E2_9SPHN|nr:TetR/AcrR family transcriptional regulator [Sphingosinithalassobacter tenebrarum]QIG80485.1 TetR/AcrR family transcriptional regulator [Sphingosinithalassobacter tenebrarum]
MARRTPPDRRDSILSAAREIFAANGFAGARMEDVAKRVGISKATLYLQFADKQALFRELIDWLIETSLPDAFPLTLADASASERLAIFAQEAAGKLADDDVAFLPRLVIGESGNFPELAKAWHDVAVSRVLTLIEGLVQQGIDRGEFRAVDPYLAARSVAGPLVLGVLWNTIFAPVGAEPMSLAALARSHVDILLHGLLQGETA